MNDTNAFDNLRLKLLAELKTNKYQAENRQFRRDFMRLIELAVFSLLHKSDNFFGNCIIQMHREIRFELPCAMGISAQHSSFNIYFNPLFLLNCSLAEIKAEIKHQIFHIIHLHLTRANNLQKQYSPLVVNLAMDIAVNQFIEDLPSWQWTIKKASAELGIDLPEKQTLETYCRIIQNHLENRTNNSQSASNSWGQPDMNRNLPGTPLKEDLYNEQHDQSHCHDMWQELDSEADPLNTGILTKRLVKNADKGCIPAELEDLIADINCQPQISWQNTLKRIIGALPMPYKKTIARKNRRQPDRLDLRGRLPNHIAKVIVAVDTSGSMQSIDLQKAFAEIFSLLKYSKNEVIVIECDCRIQKVYKAKSPRDIQYSFKGGGGTAFSPVFAYINKNGYRNSILIYFTDGEGERELQTKPVNLKTIWVLTDNTNTLSLNKPYGIVKRLESREAV